MIDRLKNERDELEKKLTKLIDFTFTEDFEMQLSTAMKDVMHRQAFYMKMYLGCLDERIKMLEV